MSSIILLLAAIFVAVFLPARLPPILTPEQRRAATLGLRAVAGVVGLVAILMTSIIKIPADRAGVVEKVYGLSSLPNGHIIALNGETGYQAEIVPPGTFRISPFFNILNRIVEVPVVVVPNGFYGRVVTADGESLGDGEIMGSFIHAPLLIFHEAGHVVFRLFGQWVAVLGGTLGQLLMPAILGGALLWKNRDPFGAAIGLWLFGVSVLDVAPYMYDAWEPHLTLLGGGTGDDSFHDWIYLFDSVNQLHHAQRIGAFTHALGVAIVLLGLAWGAGVLRLQRRHLAGNVLIER